MLAILAPGQGSQSAGFLGPWLELSAVAHRLDWASYAVGRDLAYLGTAGSDDDIRDTATCQPLLVAAGLAVAHELDLAPSFVAGHSAGELTAAALAGVLSDEAAAVLARERGAAMAEAAGRTPTGMAALLGGDADAARAGIAAAGLHVATVNGAGQLVAAGASDRLANLGEFLPAGIRVIPLRVAGAFHTPFMAPAADRFAQVANALPRVDARTPWLSNLDGAVVTSGEDVVARMLRLLTEPVRFDLVLETLDAAGVTAVIELPPAGTLTPLVRRALPNIETVALRTPDDLSAARELAHAHTAQPIDALIPWRIVVAPAGGTFTPADVAEVVGGGVVGRITGRREETAVVAAHGGHVVEWLALPGDAVRPGQPLVRLHPVAP